MNNPFFYSAPDLGHPLQSERESSFDLVLTQAEQSHVARFKCALENNRRRQNERDRQAQAERDARDLERALEELRR